jgi:hypothetical protein
LGRGGCAEAHGREFVEGLYAAGKTVEWWGRIAGEEGIRKIVDDTKEEKNLPYGSFVSDS